jgi:hypothetical protein
VELANAVGERSGAELPPCSPCLAEQEENEGCHAGQEEEEEATPDMRRRRSVAPDGGRGGISRGRRRPPGRRFASPVLASFFYKENEWVHGEMIQSNTGPEASEL